MRSSNMKFLIVIAWIFIPYIMIFLRWKKIGIVKKAFGVFWAIIALLFVLGSLLPSQPTTPLASPPSVSTKKPVPLPTATPVVESSASPSATPEVVEASASPATNEEIMASPESTTAPQAKDPQTMESKNYDVVLHFPADKYPETASHIQAAIQKGESSICTIDRPEADNNREESLQGIPTKDGYDRDEWPMAMCDEGGKGADIAYVKPSDNRGSGSWVGNQLEDYPNGTRIMFVIDGATGTVKEVTKQTPVKSPANTPAPTPANENQSVNYANCSAVKAAGKAPIRIGEPGYSTKLDRDRDGIACEK